MNAKIEQITKENFKPFGQVIELPVKEDPTIAVPTVNFWKQQAFLSFDGDAEVGVLQVKTMAMTFDDMENHYQTATGLICLTGDFVIGVATPSDDAPKAEELRAFRVPKNQLIVLAEKCWHTVSYPVDHDQSTMLVICQKDFLDNDTFYEKLDESCELSF